jgi:hypothetical protein
MKLQQIACHRNGVGGEPFHAVTFTDDRQNMFATVFEEPGHIAVFNRDKLGEGNITFGENSWRGDHYEHTLRRWISEHQASMESAPAASMVASDL